MLTNFNKTNKYFIACSLTKFNPLCQNFHVPTFSNSICITIKLTCWKFTPMQKASLWKVRLNLGVSLRKLTSSREKTLAKRVRLDHRVGWKLTYYLGWKTDKNDNVFTNCKYDIIHKINILIMNKFYFRFKEFIFKIFNTLIRICACQLHNTDTDSFCK